MAYTAPFIGAQGLVIPAYDDVLDFLLGQYRTIYGQKVYLGVDSSDYQWISAVALKISDVLQAIQLIYNNRTPASAVGAALDGIIKLNSLTRKAASASTCAVTISGTAGTVIQNGLVQDKNGLQWSLPATVTIPASGTITVTATCLTPGNISANPGDLTIKVNPTAGWTSVTNASSAIPGQPMEKDSQLRARQAISVARPGQTMLASTVALIAEISGVTRYAVYENDTNATDSLGNPAHSLTAVVEGGTDLDVATVIYINKGIGPFTNGTTSVVVADPDTGQENTIRFYRPTYVPIYVSLTVKTFTGYTSATQDAIQAALVSYLNSLQIGKSIAVSALSAVAMSVNPNLQVPLFAIESLTAGKTASPADTDDITLQFYEVSQGVAANIVITTTT